ncbi:MAG: hypothetical protein PHD13_05645 [Methanocellales archaeon]|nr:hypothetical protein [Methanocellales archaeon]MDD3291960.1 hypothetical protein [Methanocellales archaeon]MDD5235638.1 hypothetical protein [Methanocellales archaeon]MDD5485485.1 hypothetical protein [Methanocellales archaeon]
MAIINKLFSRKIEVSGDWTQRLWAISFHRGGVDYKTEPLKLEARPDIDALFSRKKLPYLWPKDKAYVRWADSASDTQYFLKIQWAIAYMHHPDPKVLIELVNTLPKLMPDAPSEVIFEHANLLAHNDNNVRTEAAKTIGKYDNVVAKLDKPAWKFYNMIPEFILEHKIEALIAIENEEANKVLGGILSSHLIIKRKAKQISQSKQAFFIPLKQTLEHLKNIKPEYSDQVMGALSEFKGAVFGYGWGEGGMGESDKTKEDKVLPHFLKADPAVIKPELERLLCLLCRYGREIKYNPIAQLLDKLEPNEFIPLLKDYLKVLEDVVEYIEKNRSAILSGLNDELRRAESGYDVKWVRDCQAQIEDLNDWKRCTSNLEGWVEYWEVKK